MILGQTGEGYDYETLRITGYAGSTGIGRAGADAGGTVGETYTIYGRKAASPSRGLAIVRRADGTAVKVLAR